MSTVETKHVALGLPVTTLVHRSDMISIIWVIVVYLLTITITRTQVDRPGEKIFGENLSATYTNGNWLLLW